jgi:hypothetical protein
MFKRLIHNNALAVALAAPLLLLSADALAMRCGNALIDKGDTQAKVLKYCGDPVQTQKSLAIRSGVYVDSRGGTTIKSSNDLLVDRGKFLPYGRHEVLVEKWIFNFGPNKLMREVIFAGGIVEDVRELSYGYRE